MAILNLKFLLLTTSLEESATETNQEKMPRRAILILILAFFNLKIRHQYKQNIKTDIKECIENLILPEIIFKKNVQIIQLHLH